MKKYLYLFLGLLLSIPIVVNADTDVTINVNSTKSGGNISTTVEINSTTPIGYYEYSLDYNSNNLKLISGSEYNVDSPNNSNTKKITKSFKFKILKEGNTKVSVKSYLVTDTAKNNLNIKVNTNSSGNNNLSKNNDLSSLEVKNFKLSPSFDKNVTTYNVSINKNIDTIEIIARPVNSKSTIEGDGTFNLTKGENTFEVVVTSESGDSKTYKIIVNESDKNPIKVTIDGKEFTVVKDIDSLDIPKGYEKTKLTINGTDVTGLYNKKIGYTLVYLKDSKDNNKLYIYNKDDNTYSLYQTFTLDKVTFIPILNNKHFKDYNKYNITIDDIDIYCYKLNKDSNYAYIYGVNTNTGDEGWYCYNEKENTIQKYNDEIDSYYNDKINNSHLLIYILAGASLIFGIIVIILASKVNKTNRKK